ncbi:hypothetical protein IQ31_04320 [Sphingobacterium siyangense]|uniref:Uncharacterized protein n=2 Tax=Sphingobacterium siyangense TaxID=459529 RepID=A0A562M956_9SPHI|nr:hypothetical protein IQ31_04320 [Sphingobacterium siyangense]
MNTLKLLTFLRLYISYIFQVLATHYLRTRPVQIKRMLRPLSSVFCLNNFAPTSAFYAIGSEFSSGFHRAIPIKTRCRPDENPMKCRNSAGIGRVMLCCIAVVSMFSLSAQTPRKDSGADGQLTKQSDIVPLQVGRKVPEEFWTKEHLFYINGDTVRRNLQEYKGKLLVLDFWMIGCYTCFLHQKEINYYKQLYKDELTVVMVNGIKTKNNYSSIHRFLKNEWIQGLGLESFSSIIESSYLDQLLQPGGYPMYYWINKYGILQTVSYRNLLDRNYVAPFLDK